MQAVGSDGGLGGVGRAPLAAKGQTRVAMRRQLGRDTGGWTGVPADSCSSKPWDSGTVTREIE